MLEPHSLSFSFIKRRISHPIEHASYIWRPFTKFGQIVVCDLVSVDPEMDHVCVGEVDKFRTDADKHLFYNGSYWGVQRRSA